MDLLVYISVVVTAMRNLLFWSCAWLSMRLINWDKYLYEYMQYGDHEDGNSRWRWWR